MNKPAEAVTPTLDFAESQRFYNAGYAAGKRAITDAMLVWLDTGPDQGDSEFAWKSAVRAALHSEETVAAAALSATPTEGGPE